jgi:multidrug resistance efflux pump
MHEGTFLHTLRALRVSGGPTMKIMATLGVLVTGAWIAWFFLARVTVYESSVQSQLEVSSAAHPVETAVEGQVVSVSLALGRPVHAGEVLVELDSTALRLQLQEEQARLDALDARAQVLREGIASAESNAQGEVKKSRVDKDAARAEYEQSRLLAQSSQEEAGRVAQLRARGLVSDAEASRSLSEAKQHEASAKAKRLGMEHASLDVQTRGDALKERLFGLQEELASLEGERKVRTATVERLKYAISLHQLRAFQDGTLGEILPLRVGETVKVGQVVASIVPQGELKVIAQFSSKAALGRIQVGQPARVHLDGFPWTQYGGLTATVSAVATQARDGSIRVELAIPPDGGSRIPRQHGLSGTVEVEVEHASPALLVLRAAGRLIEEQPREQPRTVVATQP